MSNRWAEMLRTDKFYNKNFTKFSESNKFSIDAPKKDIRKIQKVDHKFITEKNKIVIIILFTGRLTYLRKPFIQLILTINLLIYFLLTTVIK